MPYHPAHPPGFGPGDHEVGWREATHLYRRLVDGGTLTPLPNPGIILRDGEQVYGVFNLEFAQYWAAEVTETQFARPAFLLGGLVASLPGAIAGAAIDKARARRKVAKIEAPQWRDITLTNITLTNDRTLCWLDGRWRSFHHSGIMQLDVNLPAYCVVLMFGDCDPTRLRGPAALWYGVALASLVYQPAVFSTLPAFAPFAAPSANG